MVAALAGTFARFALPVALGGVVTLWVFRAPLVSIALSHVTRTPVRVRSIGVRRVPVTVTEGSDTSVDERRGGTSTAAPSTRTEAKPEQAWQVSFHDFCMKDNAGASQNALAVALLSVLIMRSKPLDKKSAKGVQLQLDVVIGQPKATVEFRNYSLTSSNWFDIANRGRARPALATTGGASRKHASKKSRSDAEAGGERQKGATWQLNSVKLEGGMTLALRTTCLEDPVLHPDIVLTDINYRRDDFTSLPAVSKWVQSLAVREMLKRSGALPKEFRTSAGSYALKVIEKETEVIRGDASRALSTMDRLTNEVEEATPPELQVQIKKLVRAGRGILGQARSALDPETWRSSIKAREPNDQHTTATTTANP
ncbi:hypothetical protein FVE85_2299 [Porphyridium purpureum]|uniref:Uncharacterized protein n=1 Tax=Porphyridium purpureum TaxID=35688 RepID=A0A5J4YZG3_PORPP|nr:hypothetical protein FVE85_2299 [Porphyridium purpureum]|eukprot:POR9022..scf209_3